MNIFFVDFKIYKNTTYGKLFFKHSFNNKDSLSNIINESKGNGSLPNV